MSTTKVADLLRQALALLDEAKEPTPSPVGRRWVSVDGDDSNDGSEAAPWRTITHAALKAPPDAEIHVGDGWWRDEVRSAIPRTFISDGAVWCASDPVDDWEWSDFGAWRTDFTFPDLGPALEGGPLIGPKTIPFAGHPEQLWHGFSPLRRVATFDELIGADPGLWWINPDNGAVWTSGPKDEQPADIHATTRRDILVAPGGEVRGFTFAHSSPHPTRFIAGVRFVDIDHRATVSDCVFAGHGASGLYTVGPVEVRQVEFLDCGKTGHQAVYFDDSLADGIEGVRCSWKNFRKSAQTGVMKVGHGRRWEIRNVVGTDTERVVWIDESARHGRISGVRGVRCGSVVMVEMSADVSIDNVTADDCGWALYLLEANSIEVADCDLVGNDIDVVILNGRRTNGHDGKPANAGEFSVDATRDMRVQPQPEEGMLWNTEDVTLRRVRVRRIRVDDAERERDWDSDMRIRFERCELVDGGRLELGKWRTQKRRITVTGENAKELIG